MPRWGDPDVDWQSIDEAAYEIGRFLERWGRIAVTQTKEKYGEVRVYCYGPANWWQRLIYRLAYFLAIRKRPHLRENILSGADWPEYLRGL